MDFLIILAILAAGAGIWFWRKRQKESGSAERDRPNSEAADSTVSPAEPDPGKQRPRPKPKPEPAPDPKPEPKPDPTPEPDPAPKPAPEPKPEPAPNPPSSADLTRDVRISVFSDNPIEHLSQLIGSDLPGTFNSTVFGIQRDHYAALRFQADHLEPGDMGSIVFAETTHIAYGPLLVTISHQPGQFGPDDTIARRLVHPIGVHNAIRWIYGADKGSRIRLPEGELYLNLVPVQAMPEDGKPQWWNPDGADRAGALIAGKPDS